MDECDEPRLGLASASGRLSQTGCSEVIGFLAMVAGGVGLAARSLVVAGDSVPGVVLLELAKS